MRPHLPFWWTACNYVWPAYDAECVAYRQGHANQTGLSDNLPDSQLTHKKKLVMH